MGMTHSSGHKPLAQGLSGLFVSLKSLKGLPSLTCRIGQQGKTRSHRKQLDHCSGSREMAHRSERHWNGRRGSHRRNLMKEFSSQ